MTGKTKITFTPPLSFTKVIMGMLCLGLGIGGFALQFWIPASIMTCISIGFFTNRRQVEFDLVKKTFKDLDKIYGLSYGTNGTFNELGFVFVKGNLYRVSSGAKGGQQSHLNLYYDGYIRYDGDQSIKLISSKDRDKVMEVLRNFAQDADLELFEYSNEARTLELVAN